MISPVSCPRIILYLLPCCDMLGGEEYPGRSREKRSGNERIDEPGLPQFIPFPSFPEEYDGNNHNDCNHDDDKNRDEHTESAPDAPDNIPDKGLESTFS